MKLLAYMLCFLGLFNLTSCKSDLRFSHGSKFLKPLNSNIYQPVILIGGFMSSPKTWLESGVADYLINSLNLAYGGILEFDHSKRLILKNNRAGKADFFVTGFHDSSSSIDSLTEELNLFIEYVLDYTNASTVTLIGHSMGGVIARNYSIKYADKKNIETIITIASPHKGSYLANLLFGTGVLAGDRRNEFLEILKAKTGLNWGPLAVQDLISNSGEGSYLSKLNNLEHPGNVNYFSIVASDEYLADIGSLLTYYGIDLPGSEDGDWVVSLESQNMDNIDFFKIKKPRVLGSYQVDGANHLSIMRKHQIIGEILESFLDRVN